MGGFTGGGVVPGGVTGVSCGYESLGIGIYGGCGALGGGINGGGTTIVPGGNGTFDDGGSTGPEFGAFVPESIGELGKAGVPPPPKKTGGP